MRTKNPRLNIFKILLNYYHTIKINDLVYYEKELLFKFKEN